MSDETKVAKSSKQSTSDLGSAEGQGFRCRGPHETRSTSGSLGLSRSAERHLLIDGPNTSSLCLCHFDHQHLHSRLKDAM